MHELSVAESLIKTLDAWQKEHKTSRILRVKLRIGRLGGIDRQSLEYVWPMAVENAENPALQGCVLEVEELPLSFKCTVCGGTAESVKFMFDCPLCGAASSLRRHGGRELIFQEIEVEDV